MRPRRRGCRAFPPTRRVQRSRPTAAGSSWPATASPWCIATRSRAAQAKRCRSRSDSTPSRSSTGIRTAPSGTRRPRGSAGSRPAPTRAPCRSGLRVLGCRCNRFCPTAATRSWCAGLSARRAGRCWFSICARARRPRCSARRWSKRATLRAISSTHCPTARSRQPRSTRTSAGSQRGPSSESRPASW